MRAALILFVTASLPVFCQEKEAEPLPVKEPSANLLQNLKKGDGGKLPLSFSLDLPASATCSIPLLNAAPPGKPVDMPKVTPPKSKSIDRMTVAPPAPACAMSFNHVGAPAPALPPPAVPPPPVRPSKP